MTPFDLTPAQFLARHWQKSPLLVRQAFPGFVPPVSPEELAGLALEDFVESRIVLEQPPGTYRLRQGPFDEETFRQLPESHWTLLVQDVNKHVPAAADLLERFLFVPRWRIDDLMISYAVRGGNVGPHVDRYDVFLLQAKGRRRWRIGGEPLMDPPLAEDQELRILREFEPAQEWVLEPGDMLYLPPGIPHHGIAEDEGMTYSIGFRAPDYKDLLQELVQAAMERLPEDDLFADPTRQQTNRPGLLSEHDLDALERGMRERLASLDMREVVARFLSRPKEHLLADQGETPPSFEGPFEVVRDESALLLYRDREDGIRLYANGTPIVVQPKARNLARRLADQRRVLLPENLTDAEKDLVMALFGHGALRTSGAEENSPD